MNDAMTHHEGGLSGDRAASGRRTPDEGVVRRRRPAVTAERAGESSDRLTAVVHEIRNLVDGSLRWVTIAERDLPKASDHPGDDALTEELERTRKQRTRPRGKRRQHTSPTSGKT